MQKKEAIKLFNNSIPDLARAIQTTRQAIYQWPETLSQRQTDRVMGAAVRLGIIDRAQSSDDEKVA